MASGCKKCIFDALKWFALAAVGSVVSEVISDFMEHPPNLLYSVERASSPLSNLPSKKITVENASGPHAEFTIATSSDAKVVSGTLQSIEKIDDVRGLYAYKVVVPPKGRATIFVEDPNASFVFSSTDGQVQDVAVRPYTSLWMVMWADKLTRATLSGILVTVVLLSAVLMSSVLRRHKKK